ncbi:MAG: hypothetical protein JWN03_6784 [Nocardia sp.]|uniref:hypothetical protein n=1 Tax=Nocardia sp. TaxID=1821 RepID=UPI0026060F92|nr:hypothetical protein [Nocardia sp.]MCU1646509.1 hypothetical protein [Nocardia sp.]
MKKLGTAIFISAAVAGIIGGGAGLATADSHVSAQPVVAVGEPDPSGTGSSSAITDLVKLLTTGSAGTPAK